MNAKKIIQLLEKPTENRIPIKDRIIDEAPTSELIMAMYEPKTLKTYMILCEILGKRKDPQAVPVLLDALHDPASSIRSEAAQALALIEDPVAGEPLLTQYLIEEGQGAKVWEVIALGAVGYRPAIPYLIQALNVENLRRYAALALGGLKVKEAKEAIQKVIHLAESPYEEELLRQSLKEIDE